MFSSTENRAYAALAFFSCLLIPIPFSLHWKVRNTGTLLIMAWGFVGTLNSGVNALAFNNTTILHSAVGCDISAVIDRTWQIGMLASSLCVLIRLEEIASTRQARWIRSDHRRRLYVDVSLGLGLPLMQVPLYFVVQGHRLNVVENLGCQAPIYQSITAIFLFYMWGIGLAAVNIIFAALITRWFIVRRRQFRAVLQASNSGLSETKYLRLLAMTCSITLVLFPLQVVLIKTIANKEALMPYISWSYVHTDYWSIWEWPMTAEYGFTPAKIHSSNASRWVTILPGLLFFAFFGLTQEARGQYMEWLEAVRRSIRPQQRKAGPSPERAVEKDFYQSALTDEDLEKVSACNGSSKSELYGTSDISLREISQSQGEGELVKVSVTRIVHPSD